MKKKTDQVLIFVEHVELIGGELTPPVEEIVPGVDSKIYLIGDYRHGINIIIVIVIYLLISLKRLHCVVPRLRPQVRVLHVGQDPMIRLKEKRNHHHHHQIHRHHQDDHHHHHHHHHHHPHHHLHTTCSMTSVSLVVSSSLISLSSRCCWALSK